MPPFLRAFFEEASAKGARSTALHSLQWGMGMLLAGIPVALWADAPTWILVTLVVLLCTVVATYLLAYVYLLFKEPDALRSEQFTTQKMALDRKSVV